MLEEILPGFYRLEIPLPDSPLKSLNSYIITGSSRNLIIDTGFNRDECFAAMQKGLSYLNIDLTCTDFFIAHFDPSFSAGLPTPERLNSGWTSRTNSFKPRMNVTGVGLQTIFGSST